MAEIQAGWYPDPEGDPVKVRYWDGTQWTDRYQRIEPVASPSQESAIVSGDAYGSMSSTDQTLRLIAFIFNLLTCIGIGILVIPLAWCIPMTVHSWGIYKGTKSNTVAFGVCTLIFVNIVSGILLLVSTKDE